MAFPLRLAVLEQGSGMTTRKKAGPVDNFITSFPCDIVFPPRISTEIAMWEPTEDSFEILRTFHIERGQYGEIVLDGLTVAIAVRVTGPLDSDRIVSLYIDDRATDAQVEALRTMFGGGAVVLQAAEKIRLMAGPGVSRCVDLDEQEKDPWENDPWATCRSSH